MYVPNFMTIHTLVVVVVVVISDWAKVADRQTNITIHKAMPLT